MPDTPTPQTPVMPESILGVSGIAYNLADFANIPPNNVFSTGVAVPAAAPIPEPVPPREWDDFKLQAYNSKPKLALLGKEQWGEFFGVELEVELEDPKLGVHPQKKAGHFTAQRLNKDKENPFVVIKSDGSLQSGGFEICSSPASIAEHRAKWEEFFEKTPENLTIRPTCGMHVHISREALSYMQIGKIIGFIHNPANKAFITDIAGRESNDYSNFAEVKTAKFAMPQFGGHFKHYSAVNLQNAGTIEIRIFASTLNKQIFFKNIEFCHALTKYCFPSLVSLASSKNYPNFVDFVKKHYKLYPALTEFLVGKGYMTIEAKKAKK